MKKRKLQVEDMLYLLFLTFFIAIGFGYLAIKHFSITIYQFPCAFHQLTHLYCPGCGGTRAIRSLMQGDIIKSLYYHPVVSYGVGFILFFMISHTVKYVTRGKIKGIKYRNVYLYIAIVIIVINVIWKNYQLIVYGIKLP